METLQELPRQDFPAHSYSPFDLQAASQMGQDVGSAGLADVPIRREQGWRERHRGGEAENGKGPIVDPLNMNAELRLALFSHFIIYN